MIRRRNRKRNKVLVRDGESTVGVEASKAGSADERETPRAGEGRTAGCKGTGARCSKAILEAGRMAQARWEVHSLTLAACEGQREFEVSVSLKEERAKRTHLIRTSMPCRCSRASHLELTGRRRDEGQPWVREATEE